MADGSRRRDVPPVIWWITATFVMLLLTYSIIQPTYRAVDEPLHVDMAEAVSDDLGYPDWDARRVDPGLIRSTQLAGFGQESVRFSSDDAVPRVERPSNDELGEEPQSTQLNQLPQHPPLYYAVLGVTDRVVDAIVPGAPFHAYDQQAWFYRALSALMVAPLPLLTWITARRLGLPRPVGITAALLPLAIPQLVHIGSAVNNDNLFVLLAWALTPVLVAIASGDLRMRTLTLAGAVTGLALFTKGMALALPLWVLLAVLLGWWRHLRPAVRPLLAPLVSCGAVALALGGWWWIRNLVVFGKLAPSIEYGRFAATEGRDTSVSRWAHSWAYYTNKRFWGDFGWIDVALSSRVLVVATVVTLVGLALAFRPRPFGLALGTRLLLLASWVLLASFTAFNSYRLYAASGHRPLMQGRYWFGAIVALALLVAVGLAAVAARRQRALPLVCATAVTVMQVAGITTIVGWYWGEHGASPSTRLTTLVAWAPFPVGVLAAGGAIAVAVAAITLVALAREMVSGPNEPPSPATTALDHPSAEGAPA